MNRANRRKVTQQPMTHTELKNIIYRNALDVRTAAVKGYSVVVATVLHDKLGFGKVRTKRTLQHIVSMFECINRGEITIEDLEKVLKEECDVVIE